MRLISIVSGLTSLLNLATAASITTIDNAVLSSATSRALASDASVIYDFILDFSNNYDSYVAYMAEKDLALPTAIGDYFIAVRTITEETDLYNFALTHSFPFSDFKTLVPEFTWYSSVLTEAGQSTFYYPEYFITAAAETSVESTANSSSRASEGTALSNTLSYSVSSSTSPSETATLSRPSSSVLSTTTSRASTSSSSSVANNAGAVAYISAFTIPLMFASLIL